MENNNNYNLIIDFPVNQNNHSHLNHNNENISVHTSTDTINKSPIFIMLIGSLIFLFLDIFSIYCSYDYLSIHISSYNTNNNLYSQCLKNRTFSEMFLSLIASLAAISAILLSVGFLINKDFFIEKLFESYAYYNYFIFGPFLLFTSIFGFINYKKIGYSCEEIPDNISINFTMLFCLVIILLLGSIITCGYSTIHMLEYMNDSIKFKNNSNYFLGKAFWKFALTRNRSRSRNRTYNFHERNE